MEADTNIAGVELDSSNLFSCLDRNWHLADPVLAANVKIHNFHSIIASKCRSGANKVMALFWCGIRPVMLQVSSGLNRSVAAKIAAIKGSMAVKLPVVIDFFAFGVFSLYKNFK